MSPKFLCLVILEKLNLSKGSPNSCVAGELGKAGSVGSRWELGKSGPFFCHRGVSTQPQCKVLTSWVKTSLGS